MKNFTKFATGDVISDAGVRIIRLVVWGSSMGRTEYVVELTCCGVQKLMTHAGVRKRGRRKRAWVPRTCKNCRGHSPEWRKQRKSNARATPEQCLSNAQAMLQQCSSNAPAFDEEFYWEVH